MDLPAEEIYNVLRTKDVKGLYHANTVRTSKTFLEQGGLLSRQYVEDNGLIQTAQKSDDLDKKLNIWNDIFLDAINISKYFSRYNKYGPVLFGFRLNLLTSGFVPTVRITKKNPIYWKPEDPVDERYFSSVQDFASKFKSGNKLNDGGYHLTLTTLNGKLPFDYLFGIQIDNPDLVIFSGNHERIVCERTIEYFMEDLENHHLVDKLEIKENPLLKVQYEILNKMNPGEFKRLFGRNG